MDQVQETRDDNASDDSGDVTNSPAYVEMVDESRLPTVCALWDLPAIATSLTGSGSGNFKKFVRDLMALVYKYVVGPHGTENLLPRLMLVYHGPVPSDNLTFTNKELLQNFSDKLNFSVWELSHASAYELVRLRRQAGSNVWPDFLDILVLDLPAATFFTPDVTDAIDDLLTRTFAATEVDPPVHVPRQFGAGLPAGGSTGSGQPSRPGTRGTSPVGTRGSAIER